MKPSRFKIYGVGLASVCTVDGHKDQCASHIRIKTKELRRVHYCVANA